jgi:hypothetical protein
MNKIFFLLILFLFTFKKNLESESKIFYCGNEKYYYNDIVDNTYLKIKTLDSLREILSENNKKLIQHTEYKYDTVYYKTHKYITRKNKFKKIFYKIENYEN